jgi:hypothetical protein
MRSVLPASSSAAATGRLVLAALFALLGFAAPPLVRGPEKARARTEPAPA